jgi:hypothetical protein
MYRVVQMSGHDSHPLNKISLVHVLVKTFARAGMKSE